MRRVNFGPEAEREETEKNECDETNETSETNETDETNEINETNEKNDSAEKNSYFSDAYHLKPNEDYESNQYRYHTDQYGRITGCEGSLRLEEGKRNPDHQKRAGGEDRLETDEGGHLIACRFDGSGKIDNLVPMDEGLNKGKYRTMENEWADELKKGNTVDVKIRCKYEGESQRPTEFIIASRVTEPDGRSRTETYRFKNGGGA